MSNVQGISKQVPLKIHNRFIEELLTDDRLSKTACQVGMKISKGFVLEWGYCSFTISQIAEYLKISARSVSYAIESLEKCGYIHIDRRFKKNHYLPQYISYESEDVSKVLHESDMQSSAKERAASMQDFAEDSRVEPIQDIELPTSTNTEKPIAFAEKANADATYSCAEGKRRFSVTSWSQFQDLVLDERGPYRKLGIGFEYKYFCRSVKKAIRTFRGYGGHIWPGLPFAEVRLAGWLRKEKVKNNYEWIFRNFGDFIDLDEEVA